MRPSPFFITSKLIIQFARCLARLLVWPGMGRWSALRSWTWSI